MRNLSLAPDNLSCPQKTAVSKVLGFTNPVTLPFRANPFVAQTWAYHLIEGMCNFVYTCLLFRLRTAFLFIWKLKSPQNTLLLIRHLSFFRLSRKVAHRLPIPLE